MTTFDTTTAEYVNSASVALPTGSDGDYLIAVFYGSEAPPAFTGWTLEATHTTTRTFTVWSKTRAGGETTATLPLISGSGGYQYSFLNVPSTFAFYSSEVTNLSSSSWSLSALYDRQAPQFVLGILNCGDSGLTFSGDFVQDSTYNDAGDFRDGFAYVADLGSGTISVSASGTWDAGGFASWLAVFFSPQTVGPNRRWWDGVVGWGPDAEIGA